MVAWHFAFLRAAGGLNLIKESICRAGNSHSLLFSSQLLHSCQFYLFNVGDYIIIVAWEWKTYKLHNTDHQKLAQLLMQMWLRVLTGNWRGAWGSQLRTRCGVHRLTCRVLATPLMPQLSGQTKLIWNYFGFCFSGSSQYGEDLGCKSDDSVGELGVDKEHPSTVYQLQLLRCTVQCSVNDSTPGNIWSLVVYALSRRHRRGRGGGGCSNRRRFYCQLCSIDVHCAGQQLNAKHMQSFCTTFKACAFIWIWDTMTNTEIIPSTCSEYVDHKTVDITKGQLWSRRCWRWLCWLTI